jgi:hypothetical protein
MKGLIAYFGIFTPVLATAFKFSASRQVILQSIKYTRRNWIYPITLSLYTSILLGSLAFQPVWGASIADMEIDLEYPGTAVQRMTNARLRARGLAAEQLDADWAIVRRHILWAGGMRDITDAPPGKGYTGHSFNDYNHCDCTTMLDGSTYNENDGRVPGDYFG